MNAPARQGVAYPEFSSPAARRLAERAMVRGLTPGEARRLDRLLAGSHADRVAYSRLARLFRALEVEPALCVTQHRRILDGVLAEVTPGRPSPWAALAAGWAGRLAPALALSVLVAVTALVFVPGRRSLDQFQARGALSSRQDLKEDRLLLRPYCIRGGVVKKGPPRLAPDTPDARCLLSDELQLMITHRVGYPYLLVFGQLVSPGRPDKLIWYYPVPPTGESGAAPGDVDYAPLGQAIHLDVNHAPGRVRVLAVFSREPLSAEVLFSWMTGLGPRDQVSSFLRRLSGDRDMAVLERWVELQPGARP